MGQLKRILKETKNIVTEGRYEDEVKRFEGEFAAMMNQYGTQLHQALMARHQDQEDIEAHDQLKALAITIMKVMGYNDEYAEKTPWMEYEMFTGQSSPEEAIEELKDLLFEMDDYLGGH